MPSENSEILKFSRKLYAIALVVYPRDLRRDFEPEILQVYDDLIADAYADRGWLGMIDVWRVVLAEVLGNAVTNRLLIPICSAITALVLMLWLAGFMVTPAALGRSCGN